jgi:hypothetical protein
VCQIAGDYVAIEGCETVYIELQGIKLICTFVSISGLTSSHYALRAGHLLYRFYQRSGDTITASQCRIRPSHRDFAKRLFTKLKKKKGNTTTSNQVFSDCPFKKVVRGPRGMSATSSTARHPEGR